MRWPWVKDRYVETMLRADVGNLVGIVADQRGEIEDLELRTRAAEIYQPWGVWFATVDARQAHAAAIGDH